MSRRCHIVLCGQSIFLSAIEAGLAALAGVEVTRFNPRLPAAAEHILALEPDMVVMARAEVDSNLVLSLLSSGLPLLDLAAAASRGIFLTGREIPISSAEDIVRLAAYAKESR